jgi:hypothetical protein
MAPSERQEARATAHALQAIFDYIAPGTNEGISFLVSRLTEDLFTDSFLGGGDLSLFTPGGHRGSLRSQLSNGYRLDPSSGPPASFALDVHLDLDHGHAQVAYTLPGAGAAAGRFTVEVAHRVQRDDGVNYLFGADGSNDDAAWTLSLLLL